MKKVFTPQDIEDKMLYYFDAYIKQVIRNAQKNYFRNSFRHTKYDYSFEPYSDEVCYLQGEGVDQKIALYDIVEKQMKIEIDSKQLYQAILELSERQREVIFLSVVSDLPMEIVAERMGISIGKAYKHRRKALSILRERLKEYE